MAGLLFATGREDRTAALVRRAEDCGLTLLWRRPLLMVEPSLRRRELANGALLLGRAFLRQPLGAEPPRDLDLPGGDAAAGRLTAALWGDYVAIIAEGAGGRLIRSPFGALEVYWRSQQDLQIAFSDPNLARRLGLVSGRLAWDFLAHQLIYPHLRLARTGDQEVQELLAGDELRLQPTVVRVRAAWRPPDATSAAWRRAPGDVATEIGTIAHACTAVLSREFQRVAVRLSGGLDSSIVAAALVGSSREVVAVHLRTPGADGDELRYAQAVTERFGAKLITVEPGAEAVLQVAPRWSLRPGPSSLLLGLNRCLSDAAAAAGAQAVFTGAGGDNIFFRPDNAAPVWDHLHATCDLRQIWRTASDLAEVARVSVWRVLWGARQRARAAPVAPDLRFLAPGGPWPIEVELPWSPSAKSATASRPHQIAALAAVQNHLFEELDAAPMLHPLLSQPLVEACLCAPPWLWVEGGRDRALARRAFADDLPDLVRLRRGKGRLDSYGVRFYLRQRAALAACLLEGRLAAAGWLDLPAIQSYLAAPGAPSDHGVYRLLELADLEAWIAAWDS